jgi:hypothetical protein
LSVGPGVLAKQDRTAAPEIFSDEAPDNFHECDMFATPKSASEQKWQFEI